MEDAVRPTPSTLLYMVTTCLALASCSKPPEATAPAAAETIAYNPTISAADKSVVDKLKGDPIELAKAVKAASTPGQRDYADELLAKQLKDPALTTDLKVVNEVFEILPNGKYSKIEASAAKSRLTVQK